MLKRRMLAFPEAAGRVEITDPDLLASLRLSPEAAARIERMERAAMRPPARILLD